MEIKARFFNPPEASFFLFGPRGTGKSTWLHRQFADPVYIDLLSPDVFRRYSARPERLKEVVAGNPQKNPVIIDEVQKQPALLDVVHQMLEEKQEKRFILTGSSSRKLKRTGTDLLAGRALVRSLHPFMASEMAGEFMLDKALESGMLPLVVSSPHPQEVLKAYASLYLREEVQMEGIVRNIGNFARFLEAISFSHAGVLNISEVARECQVGRKTVEGYVSILEDLLLSVTLPVFTRRAKRQLAAHPKFYFFDAGVYRSLRPTGPLDNPREIDGSALEGLVLQHIRAWNAYGSGKYQLSFWRTRSGTEVDFVLYGPEALWAIEVKNTSRVRVQDLKGLRAFREDYPQCTALLLYRGAERLKKGEILCIPCEEFLKSLVPGKPLPA